MDKTTRDVYREVFTDTLESVDYYERAVRYGQEIGLDTEYVRDCLIVCFMTGMRRAIKWIEKNTRCAPEILDLLKEVIS